MTESEYWHVTERYIDLIYYRCFEKKKISEEDAGRYFKKVWEWRQMFRERFGWQDLFALSGWIAGGTER